MINKYSRLLKLENYVTGEPVDFYMIKEGKTNYDHSCSIPITVTERIICIGKGYGLKYSSLIDV